MSTQGYAVNIGRIVLVGERPITPSDVRDAVELVMSDKPYKAAYVHAVGGLIVELSLDSLPTKR